MGNLNQSQLELHTTVQGPSTITTTLVSFTDLLLLPDAATVLTATAPIATLPVATVPIAHIPGTTATITPSNTSQPHHVYPHPCPRASCTNTFIRKGDLTLHIITIHQRPSRYHCHFHKCPCGIPGKGFVRKDKLVDHLMSKRHGLSKADAVYEAALYEGTQ